MIHSTHQKRTKRVQRFSNKQQLEKENDDKTTIERDKAKQKPNKENQDTNKHKYT